MITIKKMIEVEYKLPETTEDCNRISCKKDCAWKQLYQLNPGFVELCRLQVTMEENEKDDTDDSET